MFSFHLHEKSKKRKKNSFRRIKLFLRSKHHIIQKGKRSLPGSPSQKRNEMRTCMTVFPGMKQRNSLWKQRKRMLIGSLTIETALVIPIVMFFLLNMAGLVQYFAKDTTEMISQTEKAKKMAIFMYVVKRGSIPEGLDPKDIPKEGVYQFTDNKVDMFKVSYWKPWVEGIGFHGFATVNRSTCYMWVGYDGSGMGQGEQAEEKYVYVTPNGKVYHESRTCTYLAPSVSYVSDAELENARNESGGIYQICDICAGNNTESNGYYITPYGEKYHVRRNCPGILHTVNEWTLQKAIQNGRRPCSKCSAKG